MKRAIVLTPVVAVVEVEESLLIPQLALDYSGHVIDITASVPNAMPTIPNVITVEFMAEDTVMTAVQADATYFVFAPEDL